MKSLEEYREERYLTVDEFVALLRIAVGTYYRIRDGEPARPTTKRKIAAALGVHPSEIKEFGPSRTSET